MRKRKLILQATIGGFPVTLGEVKIENFATMHDYNKYVERVCPKDNGSTKYKGGYECDICGTVYPHWSHLRAVVRGTDQDFYKKRLIPEKATAKAQISKMDATAFSERFADATLSEAGMTSTDETAQMNVAKLVVAVERLGQVIILRWNDTYEERVALLTVSASNRILLQEIIPANLLRAKETMMVNMEKITEQGISEAQQILNMIPEATDDTFKVSDYRTIGLGEAPLEVQVQAPKVQELAEILAKIQ